MYKAVHKLSKQTGLAFTPQQVLKVGGLIKRALGRSDVVGIDFSHNFTDEHKEWMRKIAAVHAGLAPSERRSGQLRTHSSVNQDLYARLPYLLGRTNRKLSVISCRDLKPWLAAHGMYDIGVYQVPSQYVMRDVDDEYEARLHDVPIWPDFYAGLESELEVRDQGEVFLVGAGVFGKSLCLEIRERGGIALDMGSTLDGMAGKVTRGRNRPKLRRMPEDPTWV